MGGEGGVPTPWNCHDLSASPVAGGAAHGHANSLHAPLSPPCPVQAWKTIIIPRKPC